MMDKRQSAVIAVVIVGVLICASVGAFLLISGGNKATDDTTPSTGAGRLWVYGNANNDDYLDDRDVEYLDKIIGQEIEWNKTSAPFADANQDGVIDSKDVDQVNKILNNETTTVYYLDYWGDVSLVHYPVTGGIGTTYYQSAEVMSAIGAWGRVTAVDTYTQTNKAEYYPGIGDLYTLGDLATIDAESVLNSRVSALVCYINSDGTAQQVKSDLAAIGSTVDVIGLPIQGKDCISAAITLGVLLGSEEGAYEYMNYCDGIVDLLQDRLAGLSEDELADVVIVYLTSSTATDSIRIQSTRDSGATGDYSILSLIPMNNLVPKGDGDSWYAYRSSEWFITENPPNIICSLGSVGAQVTQEKYNDNFENWVQVFKGCGAYEDGRIVGTGFAQGSSYSGWGMLIYVASQLYPEHFTEAEGIQYLQQWFDEFTYLDIDVEDEGGFFYTGEGYQT